MEEFKYDYGFVIPVYNKPINMINKCIRSIDDSIKAYDIELKIAIIIADDHSADFSYIEKLHVTDNYTIKVIRNLENKGLFHNRYSGLKEAYNIGCKYITCIDPDDWYDIELLSKIDKELLSRDIDILNFDIEALYADGHKDRAEFPKEHEDYNSIPDILKHSGFLFHSMCEKVFKFTVVKEILDYFEPILDKLPRINNAEDFVYSLAYFDKLFTYKHISELLYKYNYGDPNNITNNSDFSKTVESMLKVIKIISDEGVLTESPYLLGRVVTELRLKQDMSHLARYFERDIFKCKINSLPTIRSSTEYCKWIEY